MIIHFFGATRTTTGSMYLLEVNGKRLLLECGLFQGHRDENVAAKPPPFRRFRSPSGGRGGVEPRAHRSLREPPEPLARHGFGGNIYCTFATRDLASIMLEDSAQIQKDDAAFVSKQRAKKGLPPVEPLYTAQDAEKAVRQFVTLNYDRPFPVLDGVTVTFKDAGHILGSAQVVLDIQEGGQEVPVSFQRRRGARQLMTFCGTRSRWRTWIISRLNPRTAAGSTRRGRTRMKKCCGW